MNGPSLYERLGGSAGIRTIVQDIVKRHMANPVISPRFLPYAAIPDKMEIIQGHLCTFIEAGCGGKAQYTGRSMRDAHRGMNINEAEYMAATDDILAVLRDHGMEEATQKDVLAIAYSLKGEILHV
jgi:hemoglobin